MREIEQALQRAELSRPKKDAATQAPGAAPVEPKEQAPQNPIRSALNKGKQSPTPQPAQAWQSLPVLKADFDRFRETFGGRGARSRNVDGAFRVLRTQVLDAMKDRGARVLGVTSPAAGAGKTVNSVHLALACARRAEQTVYLADFDFRRPAVATYLDASGYRPSLGFFRGEGQIKDYIARTEAGNLRFLLTDRPTEMSAEYLASARMDQALSQLTADPSAVVIADLPPLKGCDDTIAMMPKLDGVILVVAAGEQGFGEVRHALEQIPHEKLIATVLNKVTAENLGQEYYY